MSVSLLLPTEEQWREFWSLGDTNGDGFINDADLEMIRKAYGSRSGDARYNPKCDLNKDGAIDAKDVATCTFNYGKNIWDHFGLIPPIKIIVAVSSLATVTAVFIGGTLILKD